MYRSILVPLDGSTFAEYALPVARSIARRAGATLQLALVHVPVPARYVESMVIFDKELEARNREHEQAYLDEVIKRLATDLEVPVTSVLLDGEIGKISEVLNDHVMATGADLIVMSTHGRGALSRFWLGSVADKLVRQGLVPILLVRPLEEKKEGPDLAHEPVFQHVLIPLDGSALSEQILEPAVALGKLMQADYTLLRVLEPWMPIGYPPTEYSIRLDHQLQEQLQREAEEYLEGVAGRLRAQSLQVQVRVVFSRFTSTAILEEAGKQGIDLIAMETHGWGGLTRLLIGSVADKVLRGASVPILLQRPHGETP